MGGAGWRGEVITKGSNDKGSFDSWLLLGVVQQRGEERR